MDNRVLLTSLEKMVRRAIANNILSRKYVSFERLQYFGEPEYKRFTRMFIHECRKGYPAPIGAIYWIRYIRDPIYGLGHRDLFRYIIRETALAVPQFHIGTNVMVSILNSCLSVARPDDFLSLLDTDFEGWLKTYIETGLKSDLDSANAGKSISTLAKWLPSINTSSKDTCETARKVCRLIGMSEKEYRKTLSKLRAYGNVVEIRLSNGCQLTTGVNVPRLATQRYADHISDYANLAQARRGYFRIKLMNRGWMQLRYLHPHYILYHICKSSCGTSEWFQDIASWHKYWRSMAVSTLAAVNTDSTVYIPSIGESVMQFAYVWAGYFAACCSDPFHKHMIIANKVRDVKTILKSSFDLQKLSEHIIYRPDKRPCSEQARDIYTSLLKYSGRKTKVPHRILIITYNDTQWMDPTGYEWWDEMELKYEEAHQIMPRLHIWDIYDDPVACVPIKRLRDGVVVYSGTDEVLMNMLLIGAETHTEYYLGYVQKSPGHHEVFQVNQMITQDIDPCE